MQQEPTPLRKRAVPNQKNHPAHRREDFHPLPIPDLIVVGASAGGIEALLSLVSQLPASLPASFLIVQHLSPSLPSRLPTLLSRAGPLPARWAASDREITPGTISVAPPDHHLLVCGKQMVLGTGPREQRFRPSINVLFRSAVSSFGSGVVGVLLSGLNADGAEGLQMIKHAGGITIVQDPQDAAYPWMPRSALAVVTPDYLLPVSGIAPLLVSLCTSSPA